MFGVSIAGFVLAASAWAMLGAWGIGRVVGDRFHLTQYLSWIPTIIVMPLVVVALLASSAVGLLDEGTDRISRYGKMRRQRLRFISTLFRVVGWLGVVIMGWSFATSELNLGARVSGTRPAVADLDARPLTLDAPLRILNWNQAAWPIERAPDLIRVQKPDLAILTNVLYAVDRPTLRERGMPDAQFLEAGIFMVLSRHPVRAWGLTTFGFKGIRALSEAAAPEDRVDPGHAMWLELDVNASRPLVVWVIDLPSDPRLSRRMIASEVRAQLEAWNGTIFRASESGRWVPDITTESDGFPSPDLIIGDFNMPRSSWALQRIIQGDAREMTHAYTQAGRGFVGTWPLNIPLWHIDHAFVAPWLRATSYKVINPRAGTHWMQVVEIQSGK